MSWKKTTHEGRVMWERDGERVREVPSEPRRERHTYTEVEVPGAAFFCFLCGLILGMAVGLLIGPGALTP